MQTAYAIGGSENEFLRGLAGPEAQRILEVSPARVYSTGEAVYQPGERRSHLLLLMEGAVKVWVSGRAPLILDIVLPGEVFGEQGGEADDEQAEALERSVVRALPMEELLGANGNRTGAARRLLATYSRRVAEARRQWRSAASEDVPRRLARRLLELLRQIPEGPDPVTIPVRLRQEDLAYLVGSTRTTVSEILNEFERRGFIELRRASVRVNRERLRNEFWPQAAALGTL
jgi:CRP/FNR family transcriptional regulator